MSTKKYVPDGVYLSCDKGTAPVEFKITNNKKVFLHENPVANTADMVPMVNVKPFGNCSIMNGNPCAPAPIAWQGFEDGIFIGDFNPLLEDSVLPCGVGGKIEIHYSLEDAQAACAEEEMSFWEKVGAAVLVVAAVALIVVTGGMAIAAIGAVAAASGALATSIAVTVATLEVAGCLLTAKALYDYSQDGDEWALFKDVSLGFLFLGAGAAIAKGFKMWKAARVADDVVELGDDALKAGDDLIEQGDEAIEAATTARSIDNFVPTSGTQLIGNPEKTTTILGRWVSDMQHVKPGMLPNDFNVGTAFGEVATNPGGFNFLNIADDLANSSTDFFNQYNKPWLQAAISRGDDIVLATRPTKITDYIDDFGDLRGMYAEELRYLVQQNYKPINLSIEDWNMIKTWF